MDRKEFERRYCDEISELAENLYNTYCNTIYKPHDLDYPEWGYLDINTGNLFWETAVNLYMQELEYLEDLDEN